MDSSDIVAAIYDGSCQALLWETTPVTALISLGGEVHMLRCGNNPVCKAIPTASMAKTLISRMHDKPGPGFARAIPCNVFGAS